MFLYYSCVDIYFKAEPPGNYLFELILGSDTERPSAYIFYIQSLNMYNKKKIQKLYQ